MGLKYKLMGSVSHASLFYCSKGAIPARFIISLQNGGDLCAHRAGGASTIQIDCALAQTELYAPRVAAKM